MNKWPVVIMLLVLVTPFAVSLVLLDGHQNIGDRARGKWLDNAYYVNELDQQQWQILWRDRDCTNRCQQWENLLLRVKMALGKNQNKVEVNLNTLGELNELENGLFVVNNKGLVLLSYQATENGAYNLLKDLKVLLKHNGK